MLLAYALVFAQGAWAAQNQATKDKAASPQKAAAQHANEKQSSVATVAKTQTAQAQGEEPESAAEERPSGDGRHEGIKVHGHWTVEVKNPDGALVRHVEFENSLDPGFTWTNVPGVTGPLNVVIPGGSAYLSSLLSGQTSSSNWQIWLVGPSGLNVNLGTPILTGPCIVQGIPGFAPGVPTFGQCVIWQNTPGSATPCAPTVSEGRLTSARITQGKVVSW